MDRQSHKRKEKASKELARRRAKHDTRPRILIVCEGKKTEPNYFNGLRDDLRLGSANVEITGESDSSPTSVVAFAIKRYREEARAGFPFNQVFCVFDKDEHQDYQKALAQIRDLKPNQAFRAITSVPAFEYYLLLHYIYTTKPCTSTQVLSDLRKHIGDYTKGNADIFAHTRNQLTVAKKHAAQSLRDATSANTDNPSTNVHVLVEFMESIV